MGKHNDYQDISENEWNIIKADILARDGFRCQAACGGTQRLTVHHIIPRKEHGGYNAENLITLCHKCHDEIEDTDIRTIERIRAYDAKWHAAGEWDGLPLDDDYEAMNSPRVVDLIPVPKTTLAPDDARVTAARTKVTEARARLTNWREVGEWLGDGRKTTACNRLVNDPTFRPAPELIQLIEATALPPLEDASMVIVLEARITKLTRLLRLALPYVERYELPAELDCAANRDSVAGLRSEIAATIEN